MPKIKLEHIDALSKGKKSGIRIGSRAVPHHLHTYEREEYERALRRGYLTIDARSRPNLANLWMLVSESRGKECIILTRDGESGTITSGSEKIFEGSLSEAKLSLKKLKLL